jgi:uncharacterized protein (DUF305 family)
MKNMKRHGSIVLLLLLSSACGNQEHAGHTTAQPNTSTGATMTTNATAPYDLQFLDTMTHHHQGAVDMVRAAQGRFGHKELADAGEKIVADQQQEIAQMKAWRDQWYPGAPPAVNMNMPGMAEGMSMDMSHMTHMSGNELDVMFIDMMKPHHEGALTMAKDALAKAEHPEIRQLAQAIIDAQTREIEQFNAWRKAWAPAK